LAITGGHPDHPVEIVEPPPGFYMMSAVTVDNSTTGSVIAYFVGWHQHLNASEGVNFTLIRTIVNTQNALLVPPVLPIFQYNHTGDDRIYLHGEDFVAYNRDFKPWLFHSQTHNHLVIVDPATNSIFRVLTPTNLTALEYNETLNRYRVWYGMQITGATYDHNNGHVYIGLAAWGTLPGRIVVVDVFNMTLVKNFTLESWQSNPKSLQLSANSTILYVGLFGGHNILKINLATWTIPSQVTLGPFLTNVYATALGRDHLYFVTNEQHSKIARVPLENFCASSCDYVFGYCNNSKCLCWPEFMQINPTDQRTCEPKIAPTPGPTPAPTPVHPTNPPTAAPTWAPTSVPTKSPVDYEKKDQKDHGGEIALGILFSISTILAAVGWFLIYRGARGGGVYASLINRTT